MIAAELGTRDPELGRYEQKLCARPDPDSIRDSQTTHRPDVDVQPQGVSTQ